MTRALTCVECGTDEEVASFGLCRPCLHALTVADCEAQGVPVVITEPLAYQRLAALISPSRLGKVA